MKQIELLKRILRTGVLTDREVARRNLEEKMRRRDRKVMRATQIDLFVESGRDYRYWLNKALNGRNQKTEKWK